MPHAKDERLTWTVEPRKSYRLVK